MRAAPCVGETRQGQERRGRRLGELTAAAGASVDRSGTSGRPVCGVAADAGKVGAGYLFVAVPGSRFDGHAFVAEAVARGAIVVVAERDLPGPPVPVLRVPDPRRALAEIAAEW
jgi:UDP-N-acetylmuramyl pentapeptide synthase